MSKAPESPAQEQPGERNAGGVPLSEVTNEMCQAGIDAWNGTFGSPYTRYAAIFRAMLNAAPQAGQSSLGRAFGNEGHAAGPAVAAPDVAAMVKRLRDHADVSQRNREYPLVRELLREAAAMLEKLGQRWIPVSEMLPKKGERILLFSPAGRVEIGVAPWADHYKCTHWMPLPERP